MPAVPAFTCGMGRYAYYYPRCACNALGEPEVISRGYWEDSRPWEPSAHTRIFDSALRGDQYALQVAMRSENDLSDNENLNWASYMVGQAPPSTPSGLGPWIAGQSRYPITAWDTVDPLLSDSVPPGTYNFPDTTLVMLGVPQSDHDIQLQWTAVQQQAIPIDLLAPSGSNSQANQQRTPEQEILARVLHPYLIVHTGPQRRANPRVQHDLQNISYPGEDSRMRGGISEAEQGAEEQHERAPSVRTTTPSVDPSELDSDVEELEQALWVAQDIGENLSGAETPRAETEQEREQEQEQEQLGWPSPSSQQRAQSQHQGSAWPSSSPGLLYDSRASSYQSEIGEGYESESASSWRPSQASTSDSGSSTPTPTPTPTPRPARSIPSQATPRGTAAAGSGAGTSVQSASGSRTTRQSGTVQGAAELGQSATRQSTPSGPSTASYQLSSDPATQSSSPASSTPSREHLGRQAKRKIDYKQLNQRGLDYDQ